MPNAAAMTANRKSMSMMSIREIMNPAMASPRGLLNMPMNENMSPRIHIIHPKTGTHPKIKVIRDSTNPAVPSPFVRLSMYTGPR